MKHTFYKKPIASPFTIMKRSAISDRIKKSTIFQEALRRLLNISPDLEWTEKSKHLSEFSNCLRVSGYSHKERYECIRGAVMRYEEMCRKVEEGEIVSLNRDKAEIVNTKKEKGGLIASSWFLKGKTSRTIT